MNVGLISDIDLADLASRALYLDKPINTDAVWSIENNPTLLHGGNFLLPFQAKINDSQCWPINWLYSLKRNANT